MIRFAPYAIALLLLLFVYALLATAQSDSRPFRLVDDTTHERLVKLLPQTDDPRVEALKLDPRLIVFTGAEMPRVFQAANNGRFGLFQVGTQFNVGGTPVGHGSVRFPWRRPFGLNDATGWTSFFLAWLPPGTHVEWTRRTLANDVQSAAPIQWTFPTGTILGEALQIANDPAQPVFELRIREKLGVDNWRPDVFRPFRNREELDMAVALSSPDEAERFISYNRRESWPLSNVPLSKVVLREAVFDMLPPLAPSTVRQLLSGTFTSVREQHWVEGGHAPDTTADLHIVPKGFTGAFLPVTSVACGSCHRTAGSNVRSHGLSSPAAWDEWIVGTAGDSAFRFHPFDPTAVSSSSQFREVRMNQRLIAAGLLREKR